MIAKISNTMKDAGKLGLLFSLLFIAGILVSAYLLFTLPHYLVMKGGLPAAEMAWPVLTIPFITIGATFLAAAATIALVLQNRKEIIVYVEKKKDEGVTNTASDDETGRHALDIRSLKTYLDAQEGDIAQKGLNHLCQQLQAGQGAVYQVRSSDGKRSLELTHGFAVAAGENTLSHIEWGDGLIGQAAASGKVIYIDEVPVGYITVLSGLGEASPRFLTIVPVKSNDQVSAVWEVATFQPIGKDELDKIREIVQYISEKSK